MLPISMLNSAAGLLFTWDQSDPDNEPRIHDKITGKKYDIIPHSIWVDRNGGSGRLPIGIARSDVSEQDKLIPKSLGFSKQDQLDAGVEAPFALIFRGIEHQYLVIHPVKRTGYYDFNADVEPRTTISWGDSLPKGYEHWFQRDIDGNGIIDRLEEVNPSNNNVLIVGVFYELPSDGSISNIAKHWFGSSNTERTKAQTLDTSSNPQLLDVATKTWSKKVKLNKIVQASNNGDTITAEAPEKFVPAIGSVLNGGKSSDIIQGKTGWDIIDGSYGSDFIHGGNGRDVITGGPGGDELWGDFGLNTFKSEKDGLKDLVVIKSDHYVYNWYNDSYTNNPNGERTDFIEGLDTWDRIRVTGGYKQDLRFAENVTHMGQTGIAIYLKDSLEALYIGNDLSLDQIKNMTDGDGSEAAIANSVHQYGLDWL